MSLLRGACASDANLMCPRDEMRLIPAPWRRALEEVADAGIAQWPADRKNVSLLLCIGLKRLLHGRPEAAVDLSLVESAPCSIDCISRRVSALQPDSPRLISRKLGACPSRSLARNHRAASRSSTLTPRPLSCSNARSACHRPTSLGRLAIPPRGFGIILCDPFAILEHPAEVAHCPWFTRFRRFSKPTFGYGIILCDSFALLEHHSRGCSLPLVHPPPPPCYFQRTASV